MLIIGGGPAGLTAAATLAPRINGSVLVLEREAAAGGIPRHSDHPGYGIRDLKRFLSGPAYARRLVDHRARRRRRDPRRETMVTGWAGERTVEVTSPRGRQHIHAKRSSSPPARANDRAPRGSSPATAPPACTPPVSCRTSCTCTTQSPGTRAVIVGAELVSWSAAHDTRAKPAAAPSS